MQNKLPEPCYYVKNRRKCTAQNCQFAHNKTELAEIEAFWKSKDEAERQKLQSIQSNNNVDQNDDNILYYTLDLKNFEIQLVRGELHKERSDVIVNLNDEKLSCTNISSQKLIDAG
jgi:hypothetical protein